MGNNIMELTLKLEYLLVYYGKQYSHFLVYWNDHSPKKAMVLNHVLFWMIWGQ